MTAIHGNRTRVDAFTTEVIRCALVSITDEMKTNLMRTAYNMIIYEAEDFTTGRFDADGNTLSIGLGLPMFIRGLSDAIKAKLQHWGRDGIEPGDILLTRRRIPGRSWWRRRIRFGVRARYRARTGRRSVRLCIHRSGATRLRRGHSSGGSSLYRRWTGDRQIASEGSGLGMTSADMPAAEGAGAIPTFAATELAVADTAVAGDVIIAEWNACNLRASTGPSAA